MFVWGVSLYCFQVPCALAGEVRTDPSLEVILSAFAPIFLEKSITTAGGAGGLSASKRTGRFGEIILRSRRHWRHDSLQKRRGWSQFLWTYRLIDVTENWTGFYIFHIFPILYNSFPRKITSHLFPGLKCVDLYIQVYIYFFFQIN